MVTDFSRQSAKIGTGKNLVNFSSPVTLEFSTRVWATCWALPHISGLFVFTKILTVAPEVDFYSTTLRASHQLISGIQSGYHVKNLRHMLPVRYT